MERVIDSMTRLYSPDDACSPDLAGSLSQIDAGVTTVLDASQIHLRQSIRKRRTVPFTMPASVSSSPVWVRKPIDRERDLARLRGSSFSFHDQLMTLALLGEVFMADHRDTWRIARAHDIPIVSHVVGAMGLPDSVLALGRDRLLRDDNLLIHMSGIGD